MNVYTVVSEFRFDVAGAILGTEKLKDKVEGLSQSVDGAMQSLKATGINMILSMTGAQAGIMGLIQSSIGASSKYTNAQLSFVQIIDANASHLTGTIETMNDKMMTSAKILQDIASDARTYGISTDELYNTTKNMAAMLVPEGLAGTNFEMARTLGRNLLKSSSILGVDPSEVQGQLTRSIGGQASMGDTLFRRLISEAPEIFKKNGVTDTSSSKQFNAMDAAKRLTILNESMGKFTKNINILELRAKTMDGMFQILKDTFVGINSVLRPLGDILMPIIQKIFVSGITWINTKGRDIVKIFSAYLNKFFIDEPEKMFVDAMQAKNLSRDVSRSASIVSMTVALFHLQDILKSLAGVPIIGSIARPLLALYEGIFRFPLIGKMIKGFIGIFDLTAFGAVDTFGKLMKVTFLTLGRMAGLFAILLIPLQGFTRAVARAQVELFQWAAENAVTFAKIGTKLADGIYVLFTPIQDLIKGFEELFFHGILGGTDALDSSVSLLGSFADAFKFFADSMLYGWSILRGLVNAISGFFYSIVESISILFEGLKSGNFKSAMGALENPFGEAMKEFDYEFMKSFSRAQTPLTEGGLENQKVSSQVNNYDVKMQNNFKEVLQPDRIAFTIKDQLEKSSMNRTKARSNSVAGMNAKAVT